jgi:hypothetical protein
MFVYLLGPTPGTKFTGLTGRNTFGPYENKNKIKIKGFVLFSMRDYTPSWFEVDISLVKIAIS